MNCGHTYCHICIRGAVQLKEEMKEKDVMKEKQTSVNGLMLFISDHG